MNIPKKRYLNASKVNDTYYVKRINSNGQVVYTAEGKTFLEAYFDAIALLPSDYVIEVVEASQPMQLGTIVPGSENNVRKLINQIPGEPNV